ncbi:hypothetical protein [Glutamicibacter protophormiae]|uniref:hypothetical protein n=1 Tax=Glutamicibacter protophormiae TaxID=37930 RepID=UPI00331E2831
MAINFRQGTASESQGGTSFETEICRGFVCSCFHGKFNARQRMPDNSAPFCNRSANSTLGSDFTGKLRNADRSGYVPTQPMVASKELSEYHVLISMKKHCRRIRWRWFTPC